MDAHSEARVAEVHPELGRRVHRLEAMLSFLLAVTQGLRTYPQQDALWAKGRTTPGVPCIHNDVTRPIGSCPQHPLGLPVTKAKAGQSMHNFGLAVDGAPLINGVIDWNGKDEKWAEILAKAPSCGLAEGAQWRTFPDEPHLYPRELPANPDDNLRYLYTEGGLTAVWKEADALMGITDG